MATHHIMEAALGSVKNFKYREVQGLVRHLKRFGPLTETNPSTSSTPASLNLPNPFLPKKHPKTGQWHSAKYSLRRQADLVKKANITGTLGFLPPGPKKNAFQLRLDRLKEEKLLTEPVAEPQVPGTLAAEKKEVVMGYTYGKQINAEEMLKFRSQLKALLAERQALENSDVPEAETDAFLQKKSQLDRDISEIEQYHRNTRKCIGRLEREQALVLSTNYKPVEWDDPVGWVGEYKARKVPGAQLGIRLYAGKKRMFKGHRWERLKLGLIKKRAMLVRDMKERVRNYKEYYKKRKPNPLKPSRYTKPPKLPF